MTHRRRQRPHVAVYAIARDEEGHVERWADSARDADVLLIADTGSEDGTVGRARGLGIEVHEIRVEPFRFDQARNLALDLLPRRLDICVSLDLEEVLAPGWRAHLEAAWRRGATRIRCRLEWRWSEADPPLRFSLDRIHARHGYRWRFPVHEQIVCDGPELVEESAIEIHHLRDSTRPRPDYLELLRLGVAEHPGDGRLAHMLANEARLRGSADEALAHAHRALDLRLGPNEHLHTMLMLSWLEPESREPWIIAACSEFPDRREPWYELARLHAERGAWRACRSAVYAALRIERPADDYLANPSVWGTWLDRLAALASSELGDDDAAAHHVRRVALGGGEFAGSATDATARPRVAEPARMAGRTGGRTLGREDVLLFYEPSPFDFDSRFPKRSVGGFYAWYARLVECLRRAGYTVHVNQRDLAAANPSHPIGLVGSPTLLEGWDLPNPAVLGPALYDHPKVSPGLMRDERYRFYLVTCKWMRTLFAPFYGERCVIWYAGIEPEVWVDTIGGEKDIDILVYDKIRWGRTGNVPPVLLGLVRGTLRAHGLRVHTLRYGNISHGEYRDLLRRSRAMVFLCEHETQGMAYQEALASNVPVLAWDPGFWLDPQWSRYEPEPPPATSVPYFSDECGERFRGAGDFAATFDHFWRSLEHYRPRDFTLRALSLEGSASLYMSYYHSIHGTISGGPGAKRAPGISARWR